MPKGKDSYQALPGYEKLTWIDHMKASVKSDMLVTNPQTGAVENPRREYMKQLIEKRSLAEKAQKSQKKNGG